MIARAIVVDDEGCFYFVRANRDDDFGKATLIETAGGGVEAGEDLNTAKHADGIELQVNARNKAAYEMYKKYGFTEKSINMELGV